MLDLFLLSPTTDKDCHFGPTPVLLLTWGRGSSPYGIVLACCSTGMPSVMAHVPPCGACNGRQRRLKALPWFAQAPGLTVPATAPCGDPWGGGLHTYGRSLEVQAQC